MRSAELVATPWRERLPTHGIPKDALIFATVRPGVWRRGGDRELMGVDSEQPSFTDVEYGNRRRTSKREQFLETMDATIPWSMWVRVMIEPHYYADRPGKRGP